MDDVHDDDEMDMSDDDVPIKTNKRTKLDNQCLQVENESLKTELAVYKNDADVAKSLLEIDSDVKEQQMKVFQETIRNLQTQLLDNKNKERENLSRITELELKLKQASVKELLLKTKIIAANKNSSTKTSEIDENEIIDLDDDKYDTPPPPPPPSLTSSQLLQAPVIEPPRQPTPSVNFSKSAIEKMTMDDAKIIGLVSTFLVVHPFGASLDYIFSYVQRIAPHLRPKELEEILSRYSILFNEEVTGVGAKIERKWKFCGFGSNY